jgi:hypothetical protein
MRIDNAQINNYLKISHVAGEERQAMRQRCGRNNGVGQLDAPLLPQLDGLLDNRLVEWKLTGFVDEVQQQLHRRWRTLPGKQFYSHNNGHAQLLGS